MHSEFEVHPNSQQEANWTPKVSPNSQHSIVTLKIIYGFGYIITRSPKTIYSIYFRESIHRGCRTSGAIRPQKAIMDMLQTRICVVNTCRQFRD